MPDVAMPRLSDSMEEGTILKWLKATGDEVRRGDELVEIETDKANMTHEADQDGVLEIVAKEGDTLPVGETMARIGEAGATPAPEDGEQPERPDAASEPPAQPEAPAEPVASNGGGERVKASPIARRMAREMGVALDDVAGSGPGGRIVKADVQAASGAPEPAAAKGAPAAPVAAAQTGTAKGTVSVEELSKLQQTVARRMAESKATAPEFVISVEVDMEATVALRKELKAAAGEKPAPSFNDFVVKASALALREFPRANGAYRDGRFELYSRVNVGIAVAARDALIVPTIFDADRKSIGQIGTEARTLAERVRSGAITPPELSGGTFSVSNLGMFGIKRFTAVINPPQAAILAVGAMEQRPVVHGDEVTVRHRLDLVLTCDHRILYGADAAGFLARIRELLEQPLLLAL